jgi:PKD repeat protein
MALRAQSLEAKGNEATVQASTLPVEAHLFDEVNKLLGHWRSAGTPSVAEMTRVETRMADDAYSLLNCLDNTQANNLAPTVTFNAAVSGGNIWNFTAAVNDADGSISRYEWNFGDQTTSNATAPTHTYGTPGWYLVSCTVADDDGVTITDWGYIHAVPEPSTAALLNCALAAVPLLLLYKRRRDYSHAKRLTRYSR